jgi:hypothetical protein
LLCTFDSEHILQYIMPFSEVSWITN